MGAATINVAIEIEGDDTACDKVFETLNGMPEIFQAVVAERSRQDQQWGGAAHDDSHRPFEWESLIHQRVYHLTDCVGIAAQPRYRRALVEIAAIAVAAIQAWDRANPAKEA